MENFEQVLEQYSAMISAVMRKASIYKNYDQFRQCATIALWQAWKNYNPEKGHFAPYAYRTMLTSIYKEMERDNRYSERQIAYDKEKLSSLAQHYELKNLIHHDFPQLEELMMNLTDAERQLLVDLYVHQYKYEEIAARDGVSVVALKKRRDRLFRRVREGIAT